MAQEPKIQFSFTVPPGDEEKNWDYLFSIKLTDPKALLDTELLRRYILESQVIRRRKENLVSRP